MLDRPAFGHIMSHVRCERHVQSIVMTFAYLNILFSLLAKSIRSLFSGWPWAGPGHEYAFEAAAYPTNPGLDLTSFTGYFMAAEDDGRTEDPTEQRRRKEREKGRVAKSAEIPAVLSAIGGLVVLFLSAGWVLNGLAKILKLYIGSFTSFPAFTLDAMTTVFLSLLKEVGFLMLPFFLAVVILGVTGNLAQVGFMFTLEPLRPNFSRIAFTFENLMKRVFFSRQVMINLAKSILKVTLLIWVSYMIISADFVGVMKTGHVGVGDSLRGLAFLSFKLSLILLIILLAMAVPDYFYQRFEFTESLKMTKEEVKRERKEEEGDPLVKQRQRQRAFDMMRRSMLKHVKEADVVITNPTHFAVAVKFKFGEMAPRVVAKGEDQLALSIRLIAKQNNVPIEENKPLARTLYNTVPINGEIPAEFFAVLVTIYKKLNIIPEGQREAEPA